MPTQTQWSDADIEALIGFLWEKRSTAGDGMSFNAIIWKEAALKVYSLPDRKGGRKTSGSCKIKWARVRGSLLVGVCAHRAAVLRVVEGDLPRCGGHEGAVGIRMERCVGG